MPQEVDIYGKGQRASDGVKSPNPALAAAVTKAIGLMEAEQYRKNTSPEALAEDARRNEAMANGNAYYHTFTVESFNSEREQSDKFQAGLLEGVLKESGLDPKSDDYARLKALGDDGAFGSALYGYKVLSDYNGVAGADPLRILQYAKQFQGDTGLGAGARDGAAWALANGKSLDDAYKYMSDYNSSHKSFGEKVMNPLIKGGLAVMGGMALAGAGTAAAGATSATAGTGAAAGTAAASGSASGLAGTLGMSKGLAATALNTGALNTGVSLARGNNIGDSLKSGVTAALFSGVGGWAKGLAAPVIGSTAASVASSAATGALGAAARGGDWKDGLVTGAISGGISEASKAVGGWAKTETAEMGKGLSDAAGNVAATATNTILRGGDLGDAAKGLATTYAGKEVNDYVKETTGSDLAGSVAQDVTTSAITGKTKLNGVSSLLDSYADKKEPAKVYKKSGVADPMARVSAGWATT